MATFHAVYPSDKLAEGQPRAVQHMGVDLLLVRLDGAVYALENNCTHDDYPLTEGTCEHGEIVCPLHGARFAIRTGEVLSPPAFDDLRSFPTREVAGQVEVAL
jgi:3-phenylpropionate/trans-cinnamate dioxygenase ferredoxin subunit